MKLSEIPWDELQVGDIVSFNSFYGEIYKLISKNEKKGRYKDNIVIRWKRNNVHRISEIYHVNSDLIEYETLLNLSLRCSQE